MLRCCDVEMRYRDVKMLRCLHGEMLQCEDDPGNSVRSAVIRLAVIRSAVILLPVICPAMIRLAVVRTCLASHDPASCDPVSCARPAMIWVAVILSGVTGQP